MPSFDAPFGRVPWYASAPEFAPPFGPPTYETPQRDRSPSLLDRLASFEAEAAGTPSGKAASLTPSMADAFAWPTGWQQFNGGWNANYWIDEALKLHAQYVVLASFHSRLGYARAWPSQIPGTCSTHRDFLGAPT